MLRGCWGRSLKPHQRVHRCSEASDILRLPPQSDELDTQALRQVLKQGLESELVFPELKVGLLGLIPQHRLKTEQELLEEIRMLKDLNIPHRLEARV